MPMHDWTRVDAGLFHHFHQVWCVQVSMALNRGPLPDGFTALVEQRAGSKEMDLLAIETDSVEPEDGDVGGNAVMVAPQTKTVQKSEREYYDDKASRVVIRHRLGKVVSFIEVVSPGNKHDTVSFDNFTSKVVGAIRSRVHVLVVDLFPPTRRDPAGLHKAVWNSFEEDDPFDLPAGQNRTLASYEADGVVTAYVETAGVGEPLPPMPLFIGPGMHVVVPLEATYAAAWHGTPRAVQRLVR